MYAAVERAADAIRRHGPTPEIALVLGSGLSDVAGILRDPLAVPYADLPGWPQPRVTGHAGTLLLGTVAGWRVAALQGRVHFYEGHDAAAVTFPIRVLARLGVRQLILTNAAGGIRDDLIPGALMIIDDHISLFTPNPLVGPHDDRFGPRFPDMSEVYSRRLRARADAVARSAGLRVAHGIYAGVTGPSYETPAEVRLLRAVGADAVGSSTVAEAIVARHMGMEVLGLSCIANAAAGLAPGVLSHEEVLHQARGAREALATLVRGVIESAPQD